MTLDSGIEENLKFLVLEVKRQLDGTVNYLDSRSLQLLEAVIGRDDYIDNLKTIIQRRCFGAAADQENSNGLDALKAIDTVAVNLERIADFCEKIISQMAYIENDQLLASFDFTDMFKQISDGLDLVEGAVLDQDSRIALDICRIEPEIDRAYVKIFDRIMEQLKTSEDTQTLITILFIARYLERMGDSLLNIGEAAMSAFLGETVKINQIDALTGTLDVAASGQNIADLSLSNLGETKSGCRIDLVSDRNDEPDATMYVFKAGQLKKLSEEKVGVEYWEKMVPGIAPRVHAYKQEGENGALLFEYLKGQTMEQVILSRSIEDLDGALTRLCGTLLMVWERTLSKKSVHSTFVQQAQKRLPAIADVHPRLLQDNVRLGDLKLRSFDELLHRIGRIEKKTRAPFQVLSHGDFNLDNVIFDQSTKRIRFIDLHRTSMGDYLQDISVFMASNMRLQILDAPVRRRIEHVVQVMFSVAADFAKKNGDSGFEHRLTLGLGRSLATSTRFVLDEVMAKKLMLKSRYLFEKLEEYGTADPKHFRLPREVLVD